MQDAIKNRAAARKKGFKDPYVKPKMSKEDYLAAKAGAAPVATAPTGGTSAVDLSPLLHSQTKMQQQLQQLMEQVQRLGGGSVPTTTTTTSTGNNNATDMTAQFDQFKRDMRSSQRQAHNDLLSSVEDIVRQALASHGNSVNNGSSTTDSATSNDTAEVSRLQRQVTQLQTELADLKDENNTLRGTNTKLQKENEQLRKQQASSTSSGSHSTATTTVPMATTPAPPFSAPKVAVPAISGSGMKVEETSAAYQLSLDLPGIKISDLKISYGDGALELNVKGKEYKFEVAANLIDASSISAMLQPNGGLQITVPKKKMINERE